MGNETIKTGGKALDDLEAEVDQLEKLEGTGESSGTLSGPSDDDVEIVLAAEDEAGDPVLADVAAAEREISAAETPADGEAPAGGEDDVSSYSEKVRKRILRERDLRIAAETREESEREARVRAQTEAHNSQSALCESTLLTIEERIKQKEAELKKAKDEGKVDDDIRLSGELSDLRGKKTQVEQVRDNLKTAKPAQPNPLVHAWQKANRWFGNSEFTVESAAVRALSDDIAAKFPPNTKEHFEEIDRQLRAKMPNLAARVRSKLGHDAIRWSDGSRPASAGNGNGNGAPGEVRRQAPRLAAPGGGFGRPANAGAKRQIILTKSDMEAMRRVRLDPNNKTHVLEYAREKESLGRQQQR